MTNETVPIVIDMPVLDNEAVAAVSTFLWDIVSQFESQYFGQLQRHYRGLDDAGRDPMRPWLPRHVPPPADIDPQVRDDLDDEIAF